MFLHLYEACTGFPAHRFLECSFPHHATNSAVSSFSFTSKYPLSLKCDLSRLLGLLPSLTTFQVSEQAVFYTTTNQCTSFYLPVREARKQLSRRSTIIIVTCEAAEAGRASVCGRVKRDTSPAGALAGQATSSPPYSSITSELTYRQSSSRQKYLQHNTGLISSAASASSSRLLTRSDADAASSPSSSRTS